MKEITRIQNYWRYQKYNVMMRSYKDYKEIQMLIKQKMSFKTIKAAIQEILAKPIDNSAFINTFQHLWGYFKHDATPTEKESYTSLLTQLETRIVTYDACIQFIQNLIQKYQQPYLLQSAIMDL
ncbi:DUF1722 domain-containing protein [Staphylococcus cornubiensis]|uniref:DUF1722 domain-containing protein n=1 Tax=Staphylococcus cornubiensis TaxID=1986155 RepID=UPI000A364BC3|nr:DUF1722 domain-containing protein [Staphylococcus cornubiensis]